MSTILSTLKAIEEFNKSIEEHQHFVEYYREKEEKLHSRLLEYIIKHKLYPAETTLTKYEGEDVYKITLITNKGKLKTFDEGEIMNIQDGHFHYSDFDLGLYLYDSESGKYYKHYHMTKSDGDVIVGYLNLELGSIISDSTKVVEESTIEYVLKDHLDKELK